MKPHPRIRKAIKWGGLVLMVLIVAVWIAAQWYSLSFCNTRNSLILQHTGAIIGIAAGDWKWEFQHDWTMMPRVVSPAAPGGLLPSIRWMPRFALIGVPFWLLEMTVAVPMIAAWRLDVRAGRRATLNLCPKCGYDRTGLLQGAKCPECGVAPASV
jgi:hypothetical protein